jgi:hypothetical protein
LCHLREVLLENGSIAVCESSGDLFGFLIQDGTTSLDIELPCSIVVRAKFT